MVRDDKKSITEAIMEAAIKVFAEKGYSGTSLSVVASEAGVSKPTLYNHFDSKASLYIQMVHCVEERLLDVIDEAVESKETAREKMLAALGAQLNFARRNGELINAAHTAMYLPDELKNKMNLLGIFETRFRVMERIVKEGIEAGEFKGDSMDITMVLSGMASLGLAQALFPAFPIIQPGLEGRLAAVVFSGIEKSKRR